MGTRGILKRQKTSRERMNWGQSNWVNQGYETQTREKSKTKDLKVEVLCIHLQMGDMMPSGEW
jgi:hypothetical protein